MRRFFVLAAVACLALPCSARAKGTMAIVGDGAITCEEFGKLYAKYKTGMEDVFFNWAQGFLSAYNIEMQIHTGSIKDLGGISLDNQKAYLRGACDEHPAEIYSDAVLQMYETFPDTRVANSKK
jgi:hypothetical protein